MRLVLLVLFVLVIIGLPNFGLQTTYGYFPSGLTLALLVILLVVLMFGRGRV